MIPKIFGNAILYADIEAPYHRRVVSEVELRNVTQKGYWDLVKDQKNTSSCVCGNAKANLDDSRCRWIDDERDDRFHPRF